MEVFSDGVEATNALSLIAEACTNLSIYVKACSANGYNRECSLRAGKFDVLVERCTTYWRHCSSCMGCTPWSDCR